ALRLGYEPDTAEAEPAHRVRDLGLDLAGDVDERLVALRKTAPELELVHTDHRSELRRHFGRVLDDTRIGPNRLAIERQCELVTVAVEDAAALGGEGHVFDALVTPERGERRSIARLDVGDTHREGGEDDDDDREDPDEAPPRGRRVRAPDGTPPCARVGRP